MLAFNDTYWLKHGQDFNKGYYIIHYTETSRGGKKKEKKKTIKFISSLFWSHFKIKTRW